MFLNKLKNAVAITLCVGFLGIATGVATRTSLDRGQALQAKETIPAAEPLPRLAGTAIEQESDSGWKLRATLQGHKEEVLCLAFGVDQLATASKDGTIKLWNVTSRKEQRTCKYAAEQGPMEFMAFTADGKHIILGFGEENGYWDISMDSFPKGAFKGLLPAAVTIGPGDANTFIMRLHREESAKEDAKSLWVWQTRLKAVNADILGFTSTNPEAILRHTADVQAVAVSPDASIVATGIADKTIRVWNIATAEKAKKEQASCKGHLDVVLALALSPDNKTLASASKDGTVRLWDVVDGKALATLKGHEGPVRSVSFCPDSAMLASAGDDKTIRLWNVKTAMELTVLKGHAEAVLHVAFSRDGNVLASASKDKTIQLWEPQK